MFLPSMVVLPPSEFVAVLDWCEVRPGAPRLRGLGRDLRPLAFGPSLLRPHRPSGDGLAGGRRCRPRHGALSRSGRTPVRGSSPGRSPTGPLGSASRSEIAFEQGLADGDPTFRKEARNLAQRVPAAPKAGDPGSEHENGLALVELALGAV